MQLDKASGALYVAFSTCVIKVPLGRCERHGKCKKYVIFLALLTIRKSLVLRKQPAQLTVLLLLQNLYRLQRPILWVDKGNWFLCPSVTPQQVRNLRCGKAKCLRYSSCQMQACLCSLQPSVFTFLCEKNSAMVLPGSSSSIPTQFIASASSLAECPWNNHPQIG